MGWFENFSTFSHTKSELKGGLFNEKMPTLVFWAPYCGPFWTYWGVCQWAQNGPILKNFNFFLHKIQIQGGFVLWKKLPTHVFKAPFCRPFWTYGGGLPIDPELSNFKIFELFSTQNPNSKGVCLIKKIANSCIWGHILRAVFKNGGSADRPRIDRCKNFTTFFHTKSELKGVLFYEQIC